jgi:phasin family protein
MSQKPKAGAPVRAPSASKPAPKQAPNDTDVVKVDAFTAEPPAEPVHAQEPVATAAEAVPAIAVPPIPELEVPKAAAAAWPVDESVAATSDLAAASATATSTIITTTADTVAAVTSEAVKNASSIEPTPPTITKGIKSMMNTTEDFVAFGQANLEAFVKSGQIWSAGVQELTKQIATSAKASFDESVSTFKAMSTAKSVKEAIDLQSNFAKAALEKAMAESNKLTDASIKLTEQTLAPITARVTVAVETFGKAA